MPQAKRNLKVKRPSKVVSVAGIAGAFFASSTSGSVADIPPQSMAPFQVLHLGEEEISDVSLATFHFVDGESRETPLPRVQLARGGCGGGCGGCGGRGGGGGCGGFRGCGGCGGHGGCAGFRGCGGFRGCAGFRGCGTGFVFGFGCGGCAHAGRARHLRSSANKTSLSDRTWSNPAPTTCACLRNRKVARLAERAPSP